jgi:arginine-tRNA-protein transferase
MIFEQAYIDQLAPQQLDQLLAKGWRHFGPSFFRYSHTIHQEEICRVWPLRIRLGAYQHPKRFLKIIRKAQHFQACFRPLHITPEMANLFEQHKARFHDNVPDSLETFLSPTPHLPLLPMECAVYDGPKLIATSFFDQGNSAISSIYGMFDLQYASYSLGILTMLLEIDYAKKAGKDFYYHGYCYNVPSYYDYKKKFPALEVYNWRFQWESYRPEWHG